MTHTIIAYVLIALLGFLVFLLSRQADRDSATINLLFKILLEDQEDEEDEK